MYCNYISISSIFLIFKSDPEFKIVYDKQYFFKFPIEPSNQLRWKYLKIYKDNICFYRIPIKVESKDYIETVIKIAKEKIEYIKNIKYKIEVVK